MNANSNGFSTIIWILDRIWTHFSPRIRSNIRIFTKNPSESVWIWVKYALVLTDSQMNEPLEFGWIDPRCSVILIPGFISQTPNFRRIYSTAFVMYSEWESSTEIEKSQFPRNLDFVQQIEQFSRVRCLCNRIRDHYCLLRVLMNNVE